MADIKKINSPKININSVFGENMNILEEEKAYTEGVYCDSPANRKLGRVGMTYKEWTEKQSKKNENEDKKEHNEEKSSVDINFTNDILEENNIKLNKEESNNFNKAFSKFKNAFLKDAKEAEIKDDDAEELFDRFIQMGGISVGKDNEKLNVSFSTEGFGRMGRGMENEYNLDFFDSDKYEKYFEDLKVSKEDKKEKKSKTSNFEKEVVNFAQEIGAEKKKDFGGVYYEMEADHNGNKVKYKLRLHSDRKGPQIKQEEGALGITLERFGPSGYNFINCNKITGLPFEEQVSNYKNILKSLSKGNEKVLNKDKNESGGYSHITINKDYLDSKKD